MRTTAGAPERANPTFQKVGPNLYRLDSTGGYYALLKRADKQFRRSLKTHDRKLAERRLSELREKIGKLTTDDDARVTFEDLAKRWVDLSRHALKPMAILRRETAIKGIGPFFAGMNARNIQTRHCERWVTERGPKLADRTFVLELGVMKAIFAYAVDRGIMLNNPARSLKRRKLVQQPIAIPSREQFQKLIAAIRESDGRASSQALAKPGADLIELLAYSGCRLGEARALRWSDVDYEANALKITGGEAGTKNREQRTVPITHALRSLLVRLKAERSPAQADPIALIASAKKCLQSACRRLGYPTFSHHDFRHFFATTCIESGVDIPTVSRWLGHKDGGALAMRVYGHLRHEHSSSMIKRVTF